MPTRFICIFYVTMLCAQQPSASSRGVEMLISKAQALEARGRVDLAAQTWQQLLMINPNQLEALAGLARVARSQGKVAESEQYLNRLRTLNPANPVIVEIESLSAEKKRRSPDLEEASRLAASGQNEKAVAAYKRAFGAKVPPDLIVPFYETLAATPTGWEQATEALDQALRANPTSDRYRLSLGRLYTYRPATRMKGLALLQQVSGQFAPEAHLAWRRALEWENGSARSASSLGEYLTRYPEPEIELLAKRLPPVSSPSGTGGQDLRKAYLALKSQEPLEAERLFGDALAKNPKQVNALTGLGFVRMKQKDFAGALKNFEAAQAAGPDSRAIRDAIKEAKFWLTMQNGDEALRAGQSGEAAGYFQKALNGRPGDPAAMEGYAGALMQHGEYAAALPILERLVKEDPSRSENWKNLIIVTRYTAGPQAALALVSKIPANSTAKLNGDLEYLAALAEYQQLAGRGSEARRTFAQVIGVAEKTQTALAPDLCLQLAGLYLSFDSATSAVKLYHSALVAAPTNLDAWEGFLLASNRAKLFAPALKTLETLPGSVHEAAQARPSFLRAVAALETSVGDLALADSLLTRALTLETTEGKEPSFYTQVQIAQLRLEQGKAQEASSRFSDLAQGFPENGDIWKGLVMALQKSGSFDQALEAVHRVPATAASALAGDPDYIASLASLYRETNSTEEAAAFLQDATKRFAAEGRSIPPSLTIQLGWLLLDHPGRERDLFVLLRNARTRTDLKPEERRAINDIWTTWFIRSADASIKNGDSARAVSVLESGIRMLPAEHRLQRALGATLLAAGDPRRATSVYKAAGLQGATAPEYLAAVGASAAAGEDRIAHAWLKEALTKFPSDTELLSLAGKQAAAKGDFKKAEGFWQLALKQLQNKTQENVAESLRTGENPIRDLKLSDSTDQAGAILLSSAGSTIAPLSESAGTLRYRLPWNAEPSTTQPGSHSTDPAILADKDNHSSQRANRLIARLNTPPDATSPQTGSELQTVPFETPSAPARLLVTATKDVAPQMLASVQGRETKADLKAPPLEDSQLKSLSALEPPPSRERVTPSADLAALLEPTLPVVVAPSERDQILDQIKAVENRNSPYLGIGGNVVSRSGQAGFERMMLQESTFESSTVLRGDLRASLIGRSVFADASTPNGLSTDRYGLLPQGDTFNAPSVNGFGAEAQLSGKTFGLRVGTTPQGFPIRNILGGFRFRPGNGPITLTVDRDSVKDTILAYAGAQDPVSHRIWGGVMANSASATGNFGNEKSGAYFNLGFQYITGQAVQTNNRVDGTLGTYWRLVHTSVGSLSAGVNLFAMHYEKNLRYFTLGQGGYFSPQRFFLFNVPVTWSGRAKRIDYVVATSVGAQSFMEQASPYFPLDTLIQGKAGPYYPELSSSGLSYNFDFRAAYQIAENWFLVGYANVNNARFYSQQSAGISIRYSFGARPLGADLSIPSVPDWRGRQPFGLP